jgi:hypothetical protein
LASEIRNARSSSRPDCSSAILRSRDAERQRPVAQHRRRLDTRYAIDVRPGYISSQMRDRDALVAMVAMSQECIALLGRQRGRDFQNSKKRRSESAGLPLSFSSG